MDQNKYIVNFNHTHDHKLLNYIDWVIYNIRDLFLTLQRAGKGKVKAQADRFDVWWWPLIATFSCLCLKSENLYLEPFCKGSHLTDHLLKAALFTAITGVTFQCGTLGTYADHSTKLCPLTQTVIKENPA